MQRFWMVFWAIWIGYNLLQMIEGNWSYVAMSCVLLAAGCLFGYIVGGNKHERR